MKKFLFVTAFLLGLFQAGQLFAVPDSCLFDAWKIKDGGHNRDSVLIDTCIGSPTLGRWFAKKTYEFNTYNYFFQPKPLLIGEKYTWENIDTVFPTIRNKFKTLAETFGNYSIMRYDDGSSDSLHLEVPIFIIEFDNYVCVDSVILFLQEIDSVFGVELLNKPGYYSVEDILNQTEIVQNYGNTIYIDLKNELIIKNMDILIYDVFGNILIRSSVHAGESSISIDINTLNSGIYFLRIENSIKKFIIVR